MDIPINIVPPPPTQDELEKQFGYFANRQLLKTGKFYRFWANGKITKHFNMYSEEAEPSISRRNLVFLPETHNEPFDVITTTFLQALELRELLLLSLRQRGLLKRGEEKLTEPEPFVSLPSSCEFCSKPLNGEYAKAHIRHDGPARILCKNCSSKVGFLNQPISSDYH
jgi:hypothetical protein